MSVQWVSSTQTLSDIYGSSLTLLSLPPRPSVITNTHSPYTLIFTSQHFSNATLIINTMTQAGTHFTLHTSHHAIPAPHVHHYLSHYTPEMRHAGTNTKNAIYAITLTAINNTTLDVSSPLICIKADTKEVHWRWASTKGRVARII